MIKIHKVDASGFLVFGEDTFINIDEQVPQGYTHILLNHDEQGFYKPKLVDEMWVEGKTDEEFLEDAFLESLLPNQKDLDKAERELESVELLIELGVI